MKNKKELITEQTFYDTIASMKEKRKEINKSNNGKAPNYKELIEKHKGARDINGNLLKEDTLYDKISDGVYVEINESRFKTHRDVNGSAILKEGQEVKVYNTTDIKTFLESEVDYIDGEEFGGVLEDESKRKVFASILENLDSQMRDEKVKNKSLHEDAHFAMTGDNAVFADINKQIIRRALQKMHILDCVGLHSVPTKESYLFFERFHYAGNEVNSIDGSPLLNKERTRNADGSYNAPEFTAYVVLMTMTDVQFNAIVEGTTALKAAGGAGANLYTVVYKEKGQIVGESGKVKLLVKLDTAVVAPVAGTDYQLDTLAVDFTNEITFDPFVGTKLLLSNYGKYADTTTGETANETKMMKLSMEKLPVIAETHYIGFEISQELIDDMVAEFNIKNTKARLIEVINFQIAQSNGIKLLNLMVSSATLVPDFVYGTATGDRAQDRYAELLRKIQKEQMLISTRNNRGGANKMITSAKVCSLLKGTLGWKDGFKDGAGSGVVKHGSIYGMDVYVDTYTNSDYVLLAYKGSDHEAGVFYCVYQPLIMRQLLTGSHLNTEKYVFSERSAFHQHPDGNGANHLTFFNVVFTGSAFE